MNMKKSVALVLFTLMMILWLVIGIDFLWIYFLSGIFTFLITSIFTQKGIRFKISQLHKPHILTCFSFGIFGLFFIGITNPTKSYYTR
jgi:hypothetical protein